MFKSSNKIHRKQAAPLPLKRIAPTNPPDLLTADEVFAAGCSMNFKMRFLEFRLKRDGEITKFVVENVAACYYPRTYLVDIRLVDIVGVKNINVKWNDFHEGFALINEKIYSLNLMAFTQENKSRVATILSVLLEHVPEDCDKEEYFKQDASEDSPDSGLVADAQE